MKNVIFTFLIIFLSAVGACSSRQEGKKLFESKCGACHELKLSFKETKSLSAWKKITMRMARYSDGNITSKEAEKIALYLAKKE